MGARLAALGCTLFLSLGSGLWAADASAGAAAPAAAPAAADAPSAAVQLEKTRRDTIRYGIDSEISDLITKLSGEKEGRYNDDLLALLKASRSPKLRIATLDLFASLEWKDAESLALGLVDDRDNTDQDLVSSALSYLAAIRSKEAMKFSLPIIKEDNKKTLPALVKLMGRAGGEDEVKILLDWYDGDSATPALKEEVIRALGEIGSKSAAPRLEKLAVDTESGKVARMYACTALGKIQSDSSVGPLAKASLDSDPNVRTAAIEALGSFASGSEEAKGAIVQALRDSYAKARIAACKAAAAGKVDAALPFLKYKAQSDPEAAVQTEALRSLAVMGGESYSFLRERLEDKKETPSLRVLAFGLLCRYDPQGSMPVLQSRLKAEAAEKQREFYTSFAREIANADKAPSIAALARILASDSEYLIRVAAIEWARKNKAQDFKADLERMATADPSDMIKKRAAAALKEY
jgi:HEAT repeat protein